MYKKKKHNDYEQALNAFKASRRKEVIEAFGKLISFRPVIFENKKKYNRKRNRNY